MSDSIRTIPVGVAPAYEVSIGPGLLQKSGTRLKPLLGECRVAVITDSTVAPLYSSLPGRGTRPSPPSPTFWSSWPRST